jgi:hypothetical protein
MPRYNEFLIVIKQSIDASLERGPLLKFFVMSLASALVIETRYGSRIAYIDRFPVNQQ